MFKDLEKAKKALAGYVKTKSVREGGEKTYHVIRVNQTMLPQWNKEPDDRWAIVSETYLEQLKQHWGVTPHGDKPEDFIKIYATETQDDSSSTK